ncbi:NifU family protein [Rhodocyclaceae bacterium SMB388]
MAKVTAVHPTPNPFASKFMLDEPLHSGAPKHFRAGLGTADELGERLLSVPGVAEVYCTGEFITVTRKLTTEWDDIEGEVIDRIEAWKPKRVIDIVSAQGSDGSMHAAARSDPDAAVETETDDAELLMRVNQILDEHIRPFLDRDGGGLDILRLQDFTLTVRYKGACGGCPSASSGTLFAISNVLQCYVDDRLQVIPD